MDSIAKVRSFTDDIRKTGTWEGEPLEGFVVRTHITEPPASTSRADKATAGMLPYTPGSTFFFKIKFDEPYLMYRDWREVTKSLLSMYAKNGTMNPLKLSKSKMLRPETKVYVDWVIKEIKRNPKAFEQYQNNKGIIKTREMFLEWLASNDGKKAAEEPKVEHQPQPQFTKTIIVPIAIPGCGKTAVSVALAHIFKFGHTQSDDVRAKKAGPAFVRNVMELLKTHDVVIADKYVLSYCMCALLTNSPQETTTSANTAPFYVKNLPTYSKNKRKKSPKQGTTQIRLTRMRPLLLLLLVPGSLPFTGTPPPNPPLRSSPHALNASVPEELTTNPSAHPRKRVPPPPLLLSLPAYTET